MVAMRLFADEKNRAINRNNPALARKGSRTRQSCEDTQWVRPLTGDSQPRPLKDKFIKPLSIIQVTVAHASVASSKNKVELDSHADTYVVGDNC